MRRIDYSIKHILYPLARNPASLIKRGKITYPIRQKSLAGKNGLQLSIPYTTSYLMAGGRRKKDWLITVCLYKLYITSIYLQVYVNGGAPHHSKAQGTICS